MYRLNISYKQFYITLNDIWLYESDPNVPSTCSEPGGKQWEHSIRDWRNCGLCIRRECRERFPRHRLQRKPLVSDPGVRHCMCVTHVPWCMSGSLARGGGENIPGIPGACVTRNLTYLGWGPCAYKQGWCWSTFNVGFLSSMSANFQISATVYSYMFLNIRYRGKTQLRWTCCAVSIDGGQSSQTQLKIIPALDDRVWYIKKTNVYCGTIQKP